MRKFKIDKNTKLISCVIILFIILFATIATKENLNKKDSISTSTLTQNVETLNNNKIGWGIKRNDNNQQPNFGTRNIELMKKYNEYYIGSKDKKYIYLTFDLGYEAGYTEKILEVLKQNQIPAAFFITGHYLNT